MPDDYRHRPHVGYILRGELDRLGLADNTIIIYSTDHGLHHGEHGLGGKCFLYEEDIRIPLIIYDPRLPDANRGQMCEEMVVVPDLAPTVMDLAGFDVPVTMQGQSVCPLLENQPVDWRQDIFTEQLMDNQNYPRSESVRSAAWKYIRYFERTEDPRQAGFPFRGTLDNYADKLTSTLKDEKPVYEELFHLADDPCEEHNLAQDPAYFDMLEEMRARILVLGRQIKGDDSPPPTLPYQKRGR